VHLLLDAFAVRTGSSASVVEGLLRGWAQLAPDDEITVVSSGALPFRIPATARHEVVAPPVGGVVGGLWERVFAVRHAARRLAPDAVLSGVTASGFLNPGCRRGVIVTDLRHEIKPHQFSWSRRLARRLGYGWSYRTADVFVCISERTRDDLVRLHSRTRGRALAAQLGADHVDGWHRAPPDLAAGGPYALAFGQSENKNVGAVLDAWAQFGSQHPGWTLRLAAMSAADRRAAAAQVAALELADGVELMSWLPDDEFAAMFAGAGLVVLPSDFEGFGMPAIEGLRLGIPVVVSADAALAEVTGGHAELADPISAGAIAAAMTRAISHTPGQRQAGIDWSQRFTWQATARVVREALS
jgi:glycosyltransferase involved in cell wall biosynthesis